MNIETHLRNLRESLEVIRESIEKGLVERQRTLGFNTSAAAADMLEAFLHSKNLIDPGFTIKHEWLKSKNKVNEKLPFEFPRKQEILELIAKIEEKRNALCYGKPQKEEALQELLADFNALKEKFKGAGLDGL
ncbi:hypothetical protein HYU16_03985 [Candidatus Woesearchaeota archaeon]|nr:hypothetical protein [Candidatus Woesearchaeota archaeon]